jgi:hypothetical protein
MAVITANLTENDRISVPDGGSAAFIGPSADRCLPELRRIELAECTPANTFLIRTALYVWFEKGVVPLSVLDHPVPLWRLPRGDQMHWAIANEIATANLLERLSQCRPVVRGRDSEETPCGSRRCLMLRTDGTCLLSRPTFLSGFFSL